MDDKKYLALLIEDDLNWVRYFQETVAIHPDNCFEFHYAETLKNGLGHLEKSSYSLILLDLMLPDSQGQDTIFAIVKQIQHTPIVVLTTLADKKMEEFAFTQGIQDYLVKDEYDEKLFFHVSRAAINRSISKIQHEFYDDLAELLAKLKSVSETLDEILK